MKRFLCWSLHFYARMMRLNKAFLVPKPSQKTEQLTIISHYVRFFFSLLAFANLDFYAVKFSLRCQISTNTKKISKHDNNNLFLNDNAPLYYLWFTKESKMCNINKAQKNWIVCTWFILIIKWFDLKNHNEKFQVITIEINLALHINLLKYVLVNALRPLSIVLLASACSNSTKAKTVSK